MIMLLVLLLLLLLQITAYLHSNGTDQTQTTPQAAVLSGNCRILSVHVIIISKLCLS